MVHTIIMAIKQIVIVKLSSLHNAKVRFASCRAFNSCCITAQNTYRHRHYTVILFPLLEIWVDVA